MRILILGAGPTGLGAALRLHRLGHDDWELWEREPFVGGLARSETDEHGFTWDLGGHVQFSHYRTFDDWMDRALGPEGWLHHQRESWVRLLGTWVPYPFQNNIHRLPAEARERCLAGLEAVTAAPPRRGGFAHFEQLIRETFGEGIAELFMMPYNTKVWAWPPRELAPGWIGDRVAIPDLARVRETIAQGRDDVAWGPNNTFRFPKRGGTGAVWEALARELPAGKVRLGHGVARIAARRRAAIAADGSETSYDVLISTLPLTGLIDLAGLDELKPAAGALRWSTVHVVGVGLEGRPGPEVARKCWMYFPEDNCPFYRVTVFSNYSPNNVPDIDQYWSLMAEVSESPFKPVDAARVAEDVIDGMLATGLIARRDEVHHTWTRTIPLGYPTPSLGRDAALMELLPKLEEDGIYSRGRFGAWKYEVSNQDHSLMQGVELVNRLIHGSPELTLWFPDLVNRMHPAYGKAWL